MAAFTYTKPTVGGSEDTWGTTLNANWDALGTFLGALDSTELAVLDGITATTAELNILDGVTATTAELNSLDGISSNGSTLIAAASFNVMRDLLAIGGISGNGAGIEIGSDETGNRNSFIDLHASDGVDFSARIIREPGVNGEMDITQTGSGSMILKTTGAGTIKMGPVPDALDDSQQIATTKMVQAAIVRKALGEAQTWQAVSRSSGVSYQNTTGQTIMVAWNGEASSTIGSASVSVNNSTWVSVGGIGGSNQRQVQIAVPRNWYYRYNGSGQSVSELR